ncbi:Spy/CpxP family protein refolding chaperone [Anabaena sp. WFMT]|uniref:Spy/CpxP family protein refolding chaperone n=1 Tax=Anabaena sp. WFMT TaxID=3449730 RepID=UPI003F2558A2
MLLNRVFLMTVALITLGSSIAFAEPNPTPIPSPTPTKTTEPNVGYPGGLPKDLNLTPKQLEQVREIRRNNPVRERIQKKREELRQAQQEFLKLMAGNASKQDVNTKYRQINNLREQIANAEYQDDLEIREILNSTQRQKWVEHIQKRFPAPPNPSTQPK